MENVHGMRLRILSWNIHKCIGGLDRRYRPERVVDVIAHHAPELVMLQEVANSAGRKLGGVDVEVKMVG